MAEGVTCLVPEVATAPTPLSIETAVALLVHQVSVAEAPAVMVVGAAEIVAVGAGVPPRLHCCCRRHRRNPAKQENEAAEKQEERRGRRRRSDDR